MRRGPCRRAAASGRAPGTAHAAAAHGPVLGRACSCHPTDVLGVALLDLVDAPAVLAGLLALRLPAAAAPDLPNPVGADAHANRATADQRYQKQPCAAAGFVAGHHDARLAAAFLAANGPRTVLRIAWVALQAEAVQDIALAPVFAVVLAILSRRALQCQAQRKQGNGHMRRPTKRPAVEARGRQPSSLLAPTRRGQPGT
mmetsp:Transcript_74761/g.216054  ORF Transcript_74761/g.216054 Transcript_74761/m.216054 type:complete len:200 (+) Transcript_74761:955-1554(+)